MEPDLFAPEFEEVMNASLNMSITASLVSSLISIAFSLLVYVFMAISLYSMAKRRGIFRPWLAWLPVGNSYMLGCISDQYRSVVFNQRQSRRKLLMWLDIGQRVLSLLVGVMAILLLVKMFRLRVFDPQYIAGLTEPQLMGLLEEIMLPAMGLVLLCLPVLALSIVYMVFFYIALNDIFKSCEPGRSTLYLVLSIAVGLGVSMIFSLPYNLMPAIFMLVCHNHDYGLPLRRPACQPNYQPPAPVQNQF